MRRHIINRKSILLNIKTFYEAKLNEYIGESQRYKRCWG